MTLPKEYRVAFDGEDMNNIQDPHHDGLVITLYISNFFVRRIIVDNGSSVNIIQLDILNRMIITESVIISKSPVLVGYSGEAKSIVGEIKLPVYDEGVNSIHKFYVIDALTSLMCHLPKIGQHDVQRANGGNHGSIHRLHDGKIKEISGLPPRYSGSL
ncbi:uncharacterized protein LOC143614307 [Bidens hawaiensis]|uniref:uncharacterized protein LOC143614307 n=1 Tax=Bidens hawaiensis TaxID=980011 RepID=UPI00404999C3